jgi:hypothetical protein
MVNKYWCGNGLLWPISRYYPFDLLQISEYIAFITLILLFQPASVSEIHAMVSATKPLVTWTCRDTIQECREACGGHGYLKGFLCSNSVWSLHCFLFPVLVLIIRASVDQHQGSETSVTIWMPQWHMKETTMCWSSRLVTGFWDSGIKSGRVKELHHHTVLLISF